MVKIATLGPKGSNHELVAKRYAKAVGLQDTRLEFVEEFSQAVRLVRSGEVDCIVQCAAHPDVAGTIGENRQDLYVIDTFIAPGKPLAVLTRTDVETPEIIAFHPATRSYADLSRWTTHVEEQSTVKVADGLIAGRYDSGIAALEVAFAHPEALRVDLQIDAPHDAWLVYGRNAACTEGIIAWRAGPGAVMLRAASKEAQ